MGRCAPMTGNSWYVPPDLRHRFAEHDRILGEVVSAKRWYDEQRSGLYAVKLEAIKRANSLHESGAIDDVEYLRLREDFSKRIEPHLAEIEEEMNRMISRALDKAGVSTEEELRKLIKEDHDRIKAYRPSSRGCGGWIDGLP